VNEELKNWPGYEEHFTSGFVKHRAYTHMARKARAQMGNGFMDNGLTSLWVMSKDTDRRDEVEAVMVGVFYVLWNQPLTGGINIPTRKKSYHSVTLMLPLQRRLRTGTAMLKRCEDCIQELMIWHKMETS
jgi:hypothetical protein